MNVLSSRLAVVACIALVACLLNDVARADEIRVTAAVGVEFPPGSPVSTATGSFSFIYDDSFVGGDGVGDLFDIPLLSVSTSLNPIGQTTFDTTNSKGYVFYNEGSIRQVLVGGVDGPQNANSLVNGSDDYWITLSVLPNGEIDTVFGPPVVIRYTTSGGYGIFDGTLVSGSVSFVPVPEPGAFLLVNLGAVPFILARRRRKV